MISKKIVLLITVFTCLNYHSFAQLPKGDRIMAWQVDMAQNNNYDSAYAYAQKGCMESIHLFFTWSGIEPNTGNFDATYIANTLDIIDIYHPAYGMKAELQLATINTVAKEVPADLVTVDFDDPIMISRFKVLLDTLFAHIPNLELTALNIGNEHDVFMDTDATQYAAYKTFLDNVIPYAKQLYFNLHGATLKVGTTFTYDGLVSPTKSALCKTVNTGLDIVALTYYPINTNFTMENPSVVDSDFSALVTLYPNTSQPIYFAECGYSSSLICNSSEALQAQFYQNVFTAWDTYYANIKYLTVFKTTDWSQPEVDDFALYYGISDTIFLEYLRALGVRSWDNDGADKQAYGTILCELDARNWCSSATCLSTDVNVLNRKDEINFFPNPSSKFINFTNNVITIRLYDNKGSLVLTQKNTRIININNLPKGIYFLSTTTTNGEVKTEKLIIE